MSSFDHINRTYSLKLKKGTRCTYTGEHKQGKEPRKGTVTGTNGAHVLIKLDGDRSSFPYHPTWELTYDY